MDTTQESSSLLSLDNEEIDLGQLSKLIHRRDRILSTVQDLEQQLQAAKERCDMLSRQEIPSLMDELGLKEIKLVDGRTIKVKEILKASINKANQKAAYLWLKEKGHGDIIKSKVLFKTTKGHESEAVEVLAAIQAAGYDASKTDEVHWQTLNAWAREQYARGMEFPEEIGIFEYRETEVK